MSKFIGHTSELEDPNLEFTFDKFMDDIEKRENVVRKTDDDSTPARELTKRQREFPQNRTRFVK